MTWRSMNDEMAEDEVSFSGKHPIPLSSSRPHAVILSDARRILGISQGQLGELLGGRGSSADRPAMGDDAHQAQHRPVDRIWLSESSLNKTQDSRTESPREQDRFSLPARTHRFRAMVSFVARGPVLSPEVSLAVVDSLVCIAAETIEDVPPAAIRPAMLAAFSRAGRSVSAWPM